MEVWIDVGAHRGQKSLPHAARNPDSIVYAFEPLIHFANQIASQRKNYIVLPCAVTLTNGVVPFYVNAYEASSSVLPLSRRGVSQWIGGDKLHQVKRVLVPSIRLDTFMEQVRIEKVDYLKVDAQGLDLQVVQSAGRLIDRIQKATLEVTTVSHCVYEGQPQASVVVAWMERHGFEIESRRRQSHGQEENITFVRES
jgi:FkbM family methyltransferase